MKLLYCIVSVITLQIFEIYTLIVHDCSRINNLDDNVLNTLTKAVIPELSGKRKGEAGKIAVIGGSVEYTGAPYFTAISALKVGADLAYVITTETAAPIIKAYSPDLIVIPHNSLNISSLLSRVHIVVIGPGLGRSSEGINLAYNVINICKEFHTPLVIDADGLYAIYKNVQIIKDYPSPGIILTPNTMEYKRLKDAVPDNFKPWNKYWGHYVTVLQKGEKDMYFSSKGNLDWSRKEGGSGRRVGGQGDILAGALGTFFNWALKANLCETDTSTELAQSVASYAAAKFTRTCNSKAFNIYGRSMITSNMINEMHSAFDDLFL